MTLAAQGPAARARVAAVRIAGSGVATLAVAGVVGPLIAARHDTGAAAEFMMALGVGAALLAIASAYGLLLVLVRGRATAGAPVSDTSPESRGLATIVPYLAMIAAMVIGPPAFHKLDPYFAADVLQSARWGGAIILASALGVTLGQPLWLRLASWPSVSLFGLTAAIQASGGLLFLIIPAAQPVLLTFAAFLVGFGNGGLSIVTWAAFSETVAGLRRSLAGVAFAAFTAISKVFLALGIGIVAQVISAAQADPQVLKIAMAMGPVVGSVVMIGLAVLAVAMRKPPTRAASLRPASQDIRL